MGVAHSVVEQAYITCCWASARAGKSPCEGPDHDQVVRTSHAANVYGRGRFASLTGTQLWQDRGYVATWEEGA